MEDCDESGIDEDKLIEIIREEDGHLTVRVLSQTPAARPAANLDDLLDRVTPENLHGEVSFGKAVGRECW